MKFNCTVLLLLLVFNSMGVAAGCSLHVFNKKEHHFIFGPDGLGDLKLGMRWKKGNPVDRFIYFPENQNPAFFQDCISGQLIAAKNEVPEPFASTYLSKKRGLVSISAYKGVYTPEGIGIGSTLTEVQKAYPGADLDDTNLPPKIQVPQNKNAYYQIAFTDSKINRISALQIVLENQDCFD